MISRAWTNFVAIAFNAQVSSGTPNTVHPGTSTALWIGAVLTGIGATLAFNVKGIAAALHKNNTEFTPWGRRLQTSKWPNPARLVGWFFLIPGAVLLSLTIIAGAVSLIRHL